MQFSRKVFLMIIHDMNHMFPQKLMINKNGIGVETIHPNLSHEKTGRGVEFRVTWRDAI